MKAAEGEDGAPAAAAAAVKVGEAQAKLASLEEAFTADALAKAKDGNAPRPSERRRALDEAEYGGEGRGYREPAPPPCVLRAGVEGSTV